MTITIAPGSVVVGVDGSRGNEVAVRWAARRAQDTNSRLVIAHAVGTTPASGDVLNPEEGRRRSRAAARTVAADARLLAERTVANLEIDTVVRMGDARQALLDLSTSASVVVVGTRGRGPVKSLVLGSVSAAVASHAVCPVAVVRPGAPDDAGPRPVVAGVDGGPTTGAVLGLAYDLADCEGRPLVVVLCWEMRGHLAGSGAYSTWVRERGDRERLLEEAMALHAEKHPDVRAQRQVVEDDPVLFLVERSREAAEVVLGSRGLSWARAVIGSVSRAVVERAVCTAVVVRS